MERARGSGEGLGLLRLLALLEVAAEGERVLELALAAQGALLPGLSALVANLCTSISVHSGAHAASGADTRRRSSTSRRCGSATRCPHG